MPATAHDTGYPYGGRRLWLTDDRDTVHVRTSHGVEAWTRTKEAAGCDRHPPAARRTMATTAPGRGLRVGRGGRGTAGRRAGHAAPAD